MSVDVARAFSLAGADTAPAGAAVRDVWGRRDLGSFNGTFTSAGVAVHETRIYRLSAL